MFQKFEIGGASFRNRLIVPAIKENQADKKGLAIPAMTRHYRERAIQGAGLVMLESAYVMKQGSSDMHQLGLSSEQHLAKLAVLIKALKREGASVGVSLSHAGAKTTEDICGEEPVAPSRINISKEYSSSREFDASDRQEIIMFFVHAAERAEEAGADFIELNGTQQLLLDQCISSRYNLRDDEYGCKTLQDRFRFVCEIIQAIRERVSPEVPISYHFSLYEKLEEGVTDQDIPEIVSLLDQAGLDIFHPFMPYIMNKFDKSEDNLLALIRQNTPKPIVADGNIKSLQALKDLYEDGNSSMYVLDRALFTMRSTWFSFLKRKIESETA